MKTTHKIYCPEYLGLGKIRVKLMEYTPLNPTQYNFNPGWGYTVLGLKHHHPPKLLSKFQVTQSNETSGQYNTMQCQPKYNVNKNNNV